MNSNQMIQPGMSREEIFPVAEENAARHVGSGSARVLATPWLIAFMERVAHRLLIERLPEGYSSVGVVVNMRHLAPSPIGSNVRVRAEVIEVNGTRVEFDIRAWDETEAVGECQHQRAVIDQARFLRRIESKLENLRLKPNLAELKEESANRANLR